MTSPSANARQVSPATLNVTRFIAQAVQTEMSARLVDLSAVNVERIVERTKGASPAFLKELVGKAVLMAAERGEKTEPLRLNDVDFAGAMREIPAPRPAAAPKWPAI